jgi:SecD/SecF fusion protein
VSDYFDRVERQIVRNVEAGLPRSSRLPSASAYLATAAAVAVVIVVAGVFLLARGSNSTTPPAASHSITITFEATAIDSNAPVGPGLEPVVPILRQRLGSVFPGVRVSRTGNEIVVTAPNANADTRAGILALVTTRAQLAFYDWEANVITPNGKTVASQLQTQNPIAIQISQGGGNGAPGQPGAGSMNLYEAVTLASKQPRSESSNNSRVTDLYWMFGAPGSAACAAAAKASGTVATAGRHCLLSGPDDSKHALVSGLPAGVSASDGQILTVPRGTVVLQAIAANFSTPTPIGDPSAQFFVLKDDVALRGVDITNPRQSIDPNSRTPLVTFGFSNRGAREFQKVTANIAHRGDLVSGLGQTLNQHFAVALDDRLITVPFIDFKQYPDGLVGVKRADIAGSFTVRSAQDLATILRYGPLPVTLTATG